MFSTSPTPLVMKHNKSVSCFLTTCYKMGLCYWIPFHLYFHSTFSLSVPRLNLILIHSWSLIFKFCALLVPSSGFFPTFLTFLNIIQDVKIIILVPRINRSSIIFKKKKKKKLNCLLWHTYSILPNKSQVFWVCHCFRLLIPKQVLTFDSLLLFFINTDSLHYHPFKLYFFSSLAK